jgi:site-specific DNA recombinase
MTSAAIYARVSSARQKKDQTIGSQTAALREHAVRLGLDVPEEWVFEDEGHSGATLVRPGLEALRDLAAQGCLDVVLVYSPDRLARKFAYQALLLEEFARAGMRVEFIKNGARGDTPEDQLLVQFQGMFAEYEKAQLMERYRRGKAHRARTGSVNVLSGAPFGYRYVRKSDLAGAACQIAEDEAALVAEMFRRYADDGATLADLARWLTGQGALTRTGKSRWDRSVIWGMLRNPAYAGKAVFGKTMAVHEPAGLNRVARLQGRATPRPVKTVDRPRDQWTEIAVPAIVDQGTFDRVQARLADNKRFAARNSRVPSLLQGLAACTCCGYGYYRSHATTTAGNKIYYYRCLGSDNYRYEGGRVCGNKPVRADYLDQVVWDHITGLLADPALIRAEISKRLEQARTSDPVTRQRKQLSTALAKAATSITAMVEAYSEQLITIDELRARMPHLRAREANLRAQIDALDAQAADRDAYLKLADDLEGFLARLCGTASTAAVEDRQRVLRLLVNDILIAPEKITIRHRIPVRGTAPTTGRSAADTDKEGDHAPGYPLRWGRDDRSLRSTGVGVFQLAILGEDPGLQERLHQGQDAFVPDPGPHPAHEGGMRDFVEAGFDVSLYDPLITAWPRSEIAHLCHRVMCPAVRTEPIRARQEVRLEDGLQHQFHRCLHHPVSDGRDPQTAFLAGCLRDHPLPYRNRLEAAVLQS